MKVHIVHLKACNCACQPFSEDELIVFTDKRKADKCYDHLIIGMEKLLGPKNAIMASSFVEQYEEEVNKTQIYLEVGK